MKKSNRGFTLIELLGVVVLLAIIISLVFPNVINIIKKSNSDIDSNTRELIYNAANLTLKENPETFPNDEVTTYCLTMKDLIDYGYLIDNVKIDNDDIKSSKAVLATPGSNGYEYEIVDKEECTNIEIVPSINKCLKDKKCHICNKLSDLKDWGYIKDDVVLDGINITDTSYDFGDKSLGIKAGYVSNEECEDSKIAITYKGLPEFSKSKAKSLGITYTSTSDYYSLSENDEFIEQIRKNSSIRRNFSKDEFSTLIITDDSEYILNNKVLSIDKLKLSSDTNITAAYNVCVNDACTKVEKGTTDYEIKNLPAHTDLLVNNLYEGTGHTESTYQISIIDKDYNIYTKTMYSVSLNGNLYTVGAATNGKYEKGSYITVDLSHEEEFNTVVVNGSNASYNTTNLTYTIDNISSDTNIITKMFYTITFNNFYVTGTTSTATVEKGKSYTVYLDSSIPKAEIPFNEVVLTNQKTNTNLVSGTDYTYINSSGNLTISNVTSNILVKGYYKVTYVDNTFIGSMVGDFWNNTENILVDFSNNSAQFSKNLGSYIPDKIELKIETATSDDYTYSNKTIKIAKSKIVNNITITASDDDIWVEPPELYNGTLTPVVYMKIDTNGKMTPCNSPEDFDYDYKWVVADPNKKYYNYKKQIWANAVILGYDSNGERITKNPGDIVEISEMIAMYVWIPRYSYTVKCYDNNYSNCLGVQKNGGPTLGAYGEDSTPGAIDIKFIHKENKDNSALPKYYEGAATNWLTMPAFTIDNGDGTNQELAGIWIGKFSNSKSETDCDIKILPDMEVAFRGYSAAVDSLITKGKNYGSCDFFKDKDNLVKADSHAIKNSEWAVAQYLSQSMYGKYGNNFIGIDTVLYYNNSYRDSNDKNKLYTGRSSGSTWYNKTSSNVFYGNGYSSLANRDWTSEFGFYTYDNIKSGYKNKNLYWKEEREIYKGTGASTTGNIYGIYDMLSFYPETAIGYHTSNLSLYSNLRYENIYYINSGKLYCNGGSNLCYGHGFSCDISLTSLSDSNICDLNNCIRGGNSNSVYNGIFSSNRSGYSSYAKQRFAIFLAQ